MLMILGYVLYTVFFPLIRTVAGGLQILRIYGSKKSRVAEEQGSLVFFAADPELGPTMADGGEKTEKKTAIHSRNEKVP